MCGVLAIYGPNVEKLYQPLRVQRALSLVDHRGPDNAELFLSPDCILGHTRLAILDLSEESNQPFHVDDYVIVYNGEVFNYVELRDELCGLGVKFQTDSDTEVVARAVIRWGDQAFSKFNGMWALIMFNRSTGDLIVSRDRFGQKPLFYSIIDGITHFASEPSQLFELHGGDPDFYSIAAFLREGDALDGEDTFFLQIKEVPPASIIKCNRRGVASFEEFWRYPTEENFSDEGVEEQFLELLVDAVRIRLRSDVPLAICLSGGVDSTVIGSIIENEFGLNIAAYTFGAHGKFSEVEYAAQIAKELNFPLCTVRQPQDADDYIYRLRRLVKIMGRGHSSPAIVSNDVLHEAISSDGIKVSLDGQGADELLGGYKTFYIQHITDSIVKLRFGEVFRTVRSLSNQRTQFDYGLFSIVLFFMRNSLPRWARFWMRFLYGYEKYFFNDGAEKVDAVWRSKNNVVRSNLVNRHLRYQHSKGLRNLLFYGDAVAMNSSIENRSPFMDHRLVDFCFARGTRIKFFNGKEKAALRESFHYKRFSELLDRDKIGFESHIRSTTLKKMSALLVESPVLDFRCFNKLKLVDSLKDGTLVSEKYERFLFRLFQIHLWHECFFTSEAEK